MALRKIASIPIALEVLLALAIGAIGMTKSAGADNSGRPFLTVSPARPRCRDRAIRTAQAQSR